MKYLLVSDIHGAWPTLEKVLRHFHTLHCDMLCILGDIINYGPRNGVPEGLNPKEIAEKLNAMADKIVAIRGNCDSEVDQMLLDFPIMQDYMLLVDEGHKLLLTHGHFDAIIYGHTHLWQLSRDAQGIVCNTGSITFPKGGNPPTFATYEHGTFTILTLDGTPLKQCSIE